MTSTSKSDSAPEAKAERARSQPVWPGPPGEVADVEHRRRRVEDHHHPRQAGGALGHDHLIGDVLDDRTDRREELGGVVGTDRLLGSTGGGELVGEGQVAGVGDRDHVGRDRLLIEERGGGDRRVLIRRRELRGPDRCRPGAVGHDHQAVEALAAGDQVVGVIELRLLDQQRGLIERALGPGPDARARLTLAERRRRLGQRVDDRLPIAAEVLLVRALGVVPEHVEALAIDDPAEVPGDRRAGVGRIRVMAVAHQRHVHVVLEVPALGRHQLGDRLGRDLPARLAHPEGLVHRRRVVEHDHEVGLLERALVLGEAVRRPAGRRVVALDEEREAEASE
ncbi:MAG: hypothetical protein HC927_06455 [Deltaproteobacteria bacterium]|nr:hypothetical protein [Deltaproteobacteria bacterium]